MSLPDIKRMYCDAVDVKPVDFDWTVGYGEDDGWEIVYPDVSGWDLARCKDYLMDRGGDEFPELNPWGMGYESLREFLGSDADESCEDFSETELRDVILDSEEVLDAWREFVAEKIQEDSDSFTPMMSYYYPLPYFGRMDPSTAQTKLIGSGSAIVAIVAGETVLALAGGGMDLSWDICRAYMLLGYLPPVYFCELPAYADLPRDASWIISGCLRSIEVMRQWIANKEDSLRRLTTKREGD